MAKVRYFVDDVDAAVSFYTEHLGFELNFNAGPFAMIAKGFPTTSPCGSAVRRHRQLGPCSTVVCQNQVDGIDSSLRLTTLKLWSPQ